MMAHEDAGGESSISLQAADLSDRFQSFVGKRPPDLPH